MIDYTVAREAVEKLVHDNFTTVPVKYENVPLDSKAVVKEYIAIFSDQIDGSPLDVTDDESLVTGRIIFHIHTELDIGTERPRVIAGELADLFNWKEISEIEFETPVFTADAPTKNYYRSILMINYKMPIGEQDG